MKKKTDIDNIKKSLRVKISDIPFLERTPPVFGEFEGGGLNWGFLLESHQQVTSAIFQC